jgi:antitoxin ParD1/3/4
MIIMNIYIYDEMKTFIEARMSQDGYASASEDFRALVREAQKRKARQELEAKLLEGLQSPVSEMTAEEWQSMRRDAHEQLAGETLKP